MNSRLKPTPLIATPWFRLAIILLAGVGIVLGGLMLWRSYLALNPIPTDLLGLIPNNLPEAPRAKVLPIDTDKPITSKFTWPPEYKTQVKSIFAISDARVEWWDIENLNARIRFSLEQVPDVFLRLGEEVLIYAQAPTINENAKLIWLAGNTAQTLFTAEKGFKISNIQALYSKQTIYFTAESAGEVILGKIIPGQQAQSLFTLKPGQAKPNALRTDKEGQFAYLKTPESKCHKIDIQAKRMSDLNCAFFPYNSNNIAWELRQEDTSIYFDSLFQLNTTTGKESLFLGVQTQEEFYELHNLANELVLFVSTEGKYGLRTVSKSNSTLNSFVELTGIGLSSVGRILVSNKYIYQINDNQLLTWERSKPENSSFLNVPNCIAGECSLQIIP